MVRRCGFIRLESLFVGAFCGLLCFCVLTLREAAHEKSVNGLVVGKGDAALAGSAQPTGKLLEGDKLLNVGVFEGRGATSGSNLGAEANDLTRRKQSDASPLHDTDAKCGCGIRLGLHLGDVSVCHCEDERRARAKPVDNLIDERAREGARNTNK